MGAETLFRDAAFPPPFRYLPPFTGEVARACATEGGRNASGRGMTTEIRRDPDLQWLDHVQPVGLVVAPVTLKELGLVPLPQTALDTGAVEDLLGTDDSKPALRDPWLFVQQILGW